MRRSRFTIHPSKFVSSLTAFTARMIPSLARSITTKSVHSLAGRRLAIYCIHNVAHTSSRKVTTVHRLRPVVAVYAVAADVFSWCLNSHQKPKASPRMLHSTGKIEDQHKLNTVARLPSIVADCLWMHSVFSTQYERVMLKPRLHDTTCCQTGCQTALTTGCIVYTNIQPVVNTTGLTTGCIV